MARQLGQGLLAGLNAVGRTSVIEAETTLS
jgi:hypothetical protein